MTVALPRIASSVTDEQTNGALYVHKPASAGCIRQMVVLPKGDVAAPEPATDSHGRTRTKRGMLIKRMSRDHGKNGLWIASVFFRVDPWPLSSPDFGHCGILLKRDGTTIERMHPPQPDGAR